MTRDYRKQLVLQAVERVLADVTRMETASGSAYGRKINMAVGFTEPKGINPPVAWAKARVVMEVYNCASAHEVVSNGDDRMAVPVIGE